MISFQSCDIALSETFSLRAIDWEIAEGDCWVVLGPNGAGKSALVAALSGEGKVLAGHRRITPRNIAVVSLEEQSRLIARERMRDDSDLTDVVSAGTPVSEMLDEVCRDDALKQELTELQQKVVDECLQLHGGYGYMDEYLVCRMYADARVTRIYAGTSEIMLEVIARDL